MNYAEILAIVTNILMVQAICGDTICILGVIRDQLMPMEDREKLNMESKYWYAPLFLGVLANFTLLQRLPPTKSASYFHVSRSLSTS